MIASRYIVAITVALICLALLSCGFIVYAAGNTDAARIPEYQKWMFGDEIISVDIQVDRDEWQSMLDNATAKEWLCGDLIINGERFSTVGIRTKGNSSLSQGKRGEGGRYSLQFKANKYVKGQTFYGLDTFCVNNMMGDSTYMKDYLSYDIMNFIGVETPLTNYANVTVNGEDYGFGIALERYDKAFFGRAYNTSAGELYNVKIQMGQRGDFEDMWQDVENAFPGGRLGGRDFWDRQAGDDGGFPGGQPGGGDFGGGQAGGGMGMGFPGGRSGGGSLVYTDDEISSYSAIFDNSVFNNSDKDKQRVITALKNLNAGTDLEKYFDVDGILRYFAAHTVTVNLDSYISNMQQNYFIYERGGKITILPWDYGLAFGGFQSGNASSVVNFPIDTPVSGVNMEDRPLLNKLLEVEEYQERYHGYLRQIVEGYFESGLYESTINKLDAQINQHVKNDVSAFSTYEQYQASLPVLKELGRLRAQSIKGQLDGTIPSTSSGQGADNSALIDASGIDLNTLGSMMGGRGGGWPGGEDGQPGGEGGWPGGEGGQPGGQGGWPGGEGGQGGGENGWLGSQDGQVGGQGGRGGGEDGQGRGEPGGWPGGGMFDRELMAQAMQILMVTGGELTDDAKVALAELGLTEEQIDMVANMQGRWAGGRQGGPPGGEGRAFPGGNEGGMPGGMPGGNNAPPGMGGPGWGNGGGATAPAGFDAGYAVVMAALLLILAGATALVAKPRKGVV